MKKHTLKRLFGCIPAPERLLNLRVVTGNRRGAGTNSNVYLSLRDSTGKWLKSISLGNDFPTASVVSRDIEVAEGLEICEICIGHDNQELGAGWFLDRVTIQCSEENVVEFPCRKWLGEADSMGESGPTEVTLVPKQFHAVDERPFVCTSSVGGTPAHFKLKESQSKCKLGPEFGFAGEDAYFKKTIGHHIWLGVADGVFGWREKGVDPGIFSRALMQNILDNLPANPEEERLMKPMIHDAFQDVLSRNIEGSCTVCLVRINTMNHEMKVYVLGDSRVTVARYNESEQQYHLFWTSEESEHEFGCPKQLGSHKSSSSPDEGEVTYVTLQRNDLVIVASDGLYDNILGEDILTHLDKWYKNPPRRVDTAIRSLVEIAYFKSLHPYSDTAYARASTEHFGMIYQGGKQDDITALAVFCDEPKLK